jgi:hypothetical protein
LLLSLRIGTDTLLNTEAKRFERLFKKPSSSSRTSLTSSTYAQSVVPSIDYVPPEAHKEFWGEVGMRIDSMGLTSQGMVS